jgi:hypothetical protein
MLVPKGSLILFVSVRTAFGSGKPLLQWALPLPKYVEKISVLGKLTWV